MRYLSVDMAHHTPLYTFVYGTHSGWCCWERSKLARDLEHKAFCLVWLVLNEVLVKKAKNDFPYYSSLFWNVHMLFAFVSVLFKLYINNWVHTMFNIWYLQLSCIIYFSVLSTLCRVSFLRKCCRSRIITLRTEVFSKKMKKALHQYFQTYTTEHQPEMVPCSALRAPPIIPPTWSQLCTWAGFTLITEMT